MISYKKGDERILLRGDLNSRVGSHISNFINEMTKLGKGSYFIITGTRLHSGMTIIDLS